MQTAIQPQGYTGTTTAGMTGKASHGGYGKVILTIKSAHNLRDKAWIGKADPYCTIKVADAEIQTNVVKNAGEHATWEESFAFNNVAPDDVVYFYVYDKNLTKDALMGEGSISLRSVFEDQSMDTRVPLTNRTGTKDAGEVWISMRLEGGGGMGAGTAAAGTGMAAGAGVGTHERRHEKLSETERGTTGMETRGAEYESTKMGTTGTAGMETEHRTTTTTGVEGEVCGQQYFTKVVDQPVVVERVTRVLEHRPKEVEFVTETRPTGAETTRAGPTEELGTTERVVSEAPPPARCP